MFGIAEFKKQVQQSLRQMELQITELKKSEADIRSQNARLTQVVKNLGRKLVMRLPISVESLEKGLNYDLIFPDEIETWRRAISNSIILDIRPAHEYARGSISGSVNIPLDQISMKLDTIKREQAILLVCDNGIKSVSATELLHSKGYFFTYVLKGGMSLLKADETPIDRPESMPLDRSEVLPRAVAQ